MKSQKILSLDREIIDLLKTVPNGSKLVNDLLIDYFFAGGGQEKAELQQNITSLQDKIHKDKISIEMIKDKIKEIIEKEKEIKEKFKNIPLVILQDFKAFPKMDEDALMSRYNNEYFGTVEWKELLEAFKEYFKK